MKTKSKGEAKTSPKGDTTQKRRQSRRNKKLNEIAGEAGYYNKEGNQSWSAYETAVINGKVKITNTPE